MRSALAFRAVTMRRFVLPLTVLAATVVLLGLGTWQMQRLSWKEALIAEREAAQDLPAAALPAGIDDAEVARPFDFRTVTVTGTFRHDLEQLFGARARANVFGHHLLTPLVRDTGPAVLIDRGWVPADKAHPATRPEGQIDGEITLRGIARYRGDDRPGMFTPENEPAARQWYHYDLDSMAEGLGIELAPIVIEADDSANPGGLPIGGRTNVTLVNNHLHYAITWYGLAATLIGVYIVFRRRARPGA